MKKALHERRRLPSADRLVYWTGQENGHSHVIESDYDQDMCLCGLLSLSLSVHLICCIEVFFSMVLLIQAPDLLTMNGTYFYFMGLLDGGGETLFILHVTLCASCVLTSLLLYMGTRCTCPLLLLPHLAWQYLFIVISIGISIVLLILGFRGEMLLPSSVVLSAMLIVPATFELWWSYLTLSYYRQLSAKNSCKLRNDPATESFPTVMISTEC